MPQTWRKFVAGFDIHGDKQDAKANKVFFKFVKQYKPEIRICGGDLWDFRPLRTKASAEEKRESMQADYEAGKQWLEELKATHFVRGNHDERLWDLSIKNDGILSDYAKQAIDRICSLTRSLGCKMLPYDKREGVLRVGDLSVVHGFTTGIYAARNTALVYGNVICGHGHTIQHHSIPGITDRAGWMGGCLCQLSMDYNRAHLQSLSHRHGWIYGVIGSRGGFRVWQAEEDQGQWILPTGIEKL